MKLILRGFLLTVAAFITFIIFQLKYFWHINDVEELCLYGSFIVLTTAMFSQMIRPWKFWQIALLMGLYFGLVDTYYFTKPDAVPLGELATWIRSSVAAVICCTCAFYFAVRLTISDK